MGRQNNNGSGGRAGGEIQTEHFQPIISLPEYGTGPPFVGDKKGFSSLESFTRPRRIISSPKQKGGEETSSESSQHMGRSCKYTGEINKRGNHECRGRPNQEWMAVSIQVSVNGLICQFL